MTNRKLPFAGTRLLAALSLSFIASQAAFAAGFERGPAPTKASLEAAGSFEVASAKITRTEAKSFGYGGATIYYPKSGTQTFGIVSLTPGFLGTQSVYVPLAQRMASHGFVVINLDTNNIFDQPEQRAKQMAGAIKQVTEQAQAGKAAFSAVADTSRRAVVGHSMGGGGSLAAARNDATLKAAVPLTPWHLTKSFSTIQVPTMIVACEKDTIAPNNQHSNPFYASLNTSLARGKVEIKGADHMCPLSFAKAADQTNVAKMTIAWLKLFLDEDQRYADLVKSGLNGAEFLNYDVQGL